MRRQLLIALCSLVFAFLVPKPAVAAVDSIKYKGATVAAYFSSPDPNDTCLATSAVVFATEARIKEDGDKPQTVSEILLVVSQTNSCTGEKLVNAFVSDAPVAAEAIQVSKNLSSATVNATVEVCDYDTGADCFPVAVALTWSGTGELKKNDPHKFDSHNGSCIIHNHSQGDHRDGVAGGSVTALGIHFTPEPAFSAYLTDSKSGIFLINCE
jgi:hypothetical protein